MKNLDPETKMHWIVSEIAKFYVMQYTGTTYTWEARMPYDITFCEALMASRRTCTLSDSDSGSKSKTSFDVLTDSNTLTGYPESSSSDESGGTRRRMKSAVRKNVSRKRNSGRETAATYSSGSCHNTSTKPRNTRSFQKKGKVKEKKTACAQQGRLGRQSFRWRRVWCQSDKKRPKSKTNDGSNDESECGT
jgi:hypothetical protein